MCQFFSCIVTRQGKVLFTEDDSHETIIERTHRRDTDRHLRHWIRVELRPHGDGWAPILVDEAETPAWWTKDAPALTDRVTQIAERVRPAWTTYQADMQPARAAYAAIEHAAIEQMARAAYDAAYAAIEQSGQAAYAAALARIPGYCAAPKEA